jgi:hypothetical protein
MSSNQHAGRTLTRHPMQERNVTTRLIEGDVYRSSFTTARRGNLLIR